MKFLVSVTLLAVSAGLAVAQYSDSPAPPRLNIPGAIPLPVLRAQQHGAYRTGPVLVRTRRPLKGGRLQHQPAPLASSPSPQNSAPANSYDAKPVTEEIEEPASLSSAQPHPAVRAPQPKQLQQQHFFDSNPLGEDEAPVQARFQQQDRPAYVQPAQQKVAYRPTPPAYREQQQQQQDEQPQHRQREQQVRPTPRYNNHDNGREKKPVAQILRKYREEHEDGTITWGYENDDGSFKEETIGIDCVTRGRYGYIDVTDGTKKEYTYETGILCDPNKRDEEEQEEQVEEQEFVPHVKHFKRPQFKN